MKARRLTVCLVMCMLLFLLFPLYKVSCQNYFTYSVQINSDGSALWEITNFSASNDSVDTWEGFQNKVFNVVDSTASATHREMTIDETSLQINTTVSSASKTTEYSFLWQNFSIIQGNEIIFGDVFQNHDFFNQLYGNAALQISYPSNFSIKSLTPSPNERDDSAKTLEWARTQDLVGTTSNIVLTSTSPNENSNLNPLQYTVIGAISIAVITLSLVGFYSFKRRQKNRPFVSAPILSESTQFETEEDKVLKILKSSGGSMRQSDITDKCRFSKAKTSQLLAVLEKRGDITRYKKGRDKIVNLAEERVKGE